MDLLGDLLKTLDQMVNDQFESTEFKKFFGVPLTLERGRFYVVQNALYTRNRRDCWGYVQGAAPLPSTSACTTRTRTGWRRDDAPGRRRTARTTRGWFGPSATATRSRLTSPSPLMRSTRRPRSAAPRASRTPSPAPRMLNHRNCTETSPRPRAPRRTSPLHTTDREAPASLLVGRDRGRTPLIHSRRRAGPGLGARRDLLEAVLRPVHRRSRRHRQRLHQLHPDGCLCMAPRSGQGAAGPAGRRRHQRNGDDALEGRTD